MKHEMPLWQKVYSQPEYTAVARAVGYKGIQVRDLGPLIETLAKEFGKAKVESAIYYLTVYEGQMTATPKPLAKVELRQHVRRICFQLLGPAPEQEDAFYRHPDGSPRERPARPEPQPEPKPEANGKPKTKKPPRKEKK